MSKEEDIGKLPGLFETEHSKAFQSLRMGIKSSEGFLKAKDEFKGEQNLWLSGLRTRLLVLDGRIDTVKNLIPRHKHDEIVAKGLLEEASETRKGLLREIKSFELPAEKELRRLLK